MAGSEQNHRTNYHVLTMDDPQFRIKPTQQIVSACTGALTTSLFMTPLDVIKTRIQAQQKMLLSNKCFLYCNGLMDHLCPCGPESPPIAPKTLHLKGTLDAFVKISRYEGMSTLWSGLGPTLVSALPATVIYFVAYEQIKAQMKLFHDHYVTTPTLPNRQTSLPLYVPLLSGISARILAVSFVSPLELMRTKMQSQKLSYFEMNKAIRSMIQSEGVMALWKGLPPTIYRDVPFSGIYWTSYEYIKSVCNVTEPSFGFSFVDGAISGSIAAFLTTPFDVVKTHQQIEFGEKVIYAEKPAKNIPSKSTLNSLKEIYVQHGLRGIFSGLGPRLAKVAPACAIMISSFEYGKSFFYKYNAQMHLEQTSSSIPLVERERHF